MLQTLSVFIIIYFALGVRGGVSTITTRYYRANNKYLSWYEPNKKMVYLLDLDANNLYGRPYIYLISHDITISNVHTQSNEII